MPHDMTRLAAISAAVLALGAAPVLAQDTMSQWDENGDSAINQQEFNAGFDQQGTFSDWDQDGNGALSEDEFNSGLGEGDMTADADFSTWDQNGDSALSQDEFNSGVYGQYDADQSGDWNQDEYASYEDEGIW